MNRILLTGNLCKEVAPCKTKNGKLMVKNTIAVIDGYKTDYQKTYFINIEAYSDTAKKFKEFKKGNMVEIEGKLVVENFKNKEGQWVNITKVVVFEIRAVEFKKKELVEVAEDLSWD